MAVPNLPRNKYETEYFQKTRDANPERWNREMKWFDSNIFKVWKEWTLKETLLKINEDVQQHKSGFTNSLLVSTDDSRCGQWAVYPACLHIAHEINKIPGYSAVCTESFPSQDYTKLVYTVSDSVYQ